MPSINWNLVFSRPLASAKIAGLASLRTVVVILRRLNPFASYHLSLRNAIARAWLGTIFSINASIFYEAPSGHDAQLISDTSFQAYLVPTTPIQELKSADCVVLFAHGGGMVIGHPLQYLKEYKRWAATAAKKGKIIRFLAVRYPLSTSARWPAQGRAMVAAYSWLLRQGISPQHIAFAGDSAGGNLALLTALLIRDTEPDMSLPACIVLQSPWLDMTAAETAHSPNASNDFMFDYATGSAIMNSMLRPEGAEPSTPEISALLAENVGGLPPQLIAYSPTELLATDSERWITRSRLAGVDILEYAVHGEMHTFALGWPISSGKLQGEFDVLFCDYLVKHTSST